MALTERSTVVGVFQDYKMAEQAIASLLAAGFTNDQMRYSGHDPILAGSVLEHIKSVFTKQDDTNESMTQELIVLGISEPEALYYSREMASGRMLVLVSPNGRTQDAVNALQSNGAYGYSGGPTETTGYVDTSKS